MVIELSKYKQYTFAVKQLIPAVKYDFVIRENISSYTIKFSKQMSVVLLIYSGRHNLKITLPFLANQTLNLRSCAQTMTMT